MSFTQNYYLVLRLPASAPQSPDWKPTLRRAYKAALLNAHPDKRAAERKQPPSTGSSGSYNNGNGVDEENQAYTVDDVKEALAVLSDEKRRAEFERWLRTAHTQTRATGGGTDASGDAQGRGGAVGEDFVLGLELLDLSDFEASMPFERIPEAEDEDEEEEEEEGEGEEGEGVEEVEDFEDMVARLRVQNEVLGADGENGSIGKEGEEQKQQQEDEEEEGVKSGRDTPGEEDVQTQTQMQWTRACRCGAEAGFRILESELEDAEGRGEKEVLVGCEGCSLWVRVGFDVEEG